MGKFDILKTFVYQKECANFFTFCKFKIFTSKKKFYKGQNQEKNQKNPASTNAEYREKCSTHEEETLNSYCSW